MSKALIGLGAAAMAVLVACSGGSGSTPSASGGSPDKYCALIRAYADKYEQAPTPTDSPQAIRTLYADSARDIRSAMAVAPDQIRADVATVAAGLDRLITVLERFDYDASRLAQSPDALQGLDTPEFEAAGQRVDEYTRSQCGPS